MAEAGRPRSGFGPVVLAGLASAALCAVASTKPWYRAAVDLAEMPGVREPDTRADMPLALALCLVILAAWGVVLVSRTTGRRVVLALAGLAGLGVLACVVSAVTSLPDQVREQLAGDVEGVGVSPTAWFFVAAVSAVTGLGAVVVGWRSVPSWPSMSAKYDGPAGAAGVPVEQTDLWKAFDAGHDPTAADEPRSP